MNGPTPADDVELVRRAQTGDRTAFGEIVATYQRPALRLATIICADSNEAHDVVQEAFVRAFHALPTIRTGDSLKPWLMRIVANQAKNTRRSRWRREARADRHVRLDIHRIDGATGADDAALRTIEAERLLKAMQRLSRPDRDVLACRYFAEMNEAETATALAIPAGTVKSRTSRALGRLRAQLSDEEGEA